MALVLLVSLVVAWALFSIMRRGCQAGHFSNSLLGTLLWNFIALGNAGTVYHGWIDHCTCRTVFDGFVILRPKVATSPLG
jgi:hypothetical protein